MKWIKQENKKRPNNPIKYKILSWIRANRLTLSFNKHYDAVFYFGHGLKDRLGDFFIYILPIISKRNVHWFKDKIIYTMACDSSQELGKFAIERGVRAYFGQTKKYYAFQPSLNYKYLNDWYDLIISIPKYLMCGDSCFMALQKYEKKANELYSKYLNLNNRMNISMLFSNAMYLELYGDKSATLPI